MGEEWAGREAWVCEIEIYLNLEPVSSRYATMVENPPHVPAGNKTHWLYNCHCRWRLDLGFFPSRIFPISC